MHGDHKWCLEYVKVKETLYFWVIKVWKKIAISSEYHISKFPNLFHICKKDLETSVLLLKKCEMCYEYIDSWESLKEKSLPP